MRREAGSAGRYTLGILAGGRATRLGGRDKAWMERDGVPQVLRIARRFPDAARVLASANRDHARYRDAGIEPIADRTADAGPLGGVEALARACTDDWLLTLPVDLVGFNECLLPSLHAAAGATGAWARDEDGPQPLVALWPVPALRAAAADALAAGRLSVQALQADMRMAEVRFAGVRFGNLNTPDDLRAAGFPE
jgi:molybdopterin-guanine dinucleotide biosynthesis protein A